MKEGQILIEDQSGMLSEGRLDEIVTSDPRLSAKYFNGSDLRKQSASSVMQQKKQDYLFKSHVEGFRSHFKSIPTDLDDG